MFKFGIIGVGNMGQAILKALVEKANISPEDIAIFDIDSKKVKDLKKELNVNVLFDINELIKNSKYIFIVVKPKDYKDLLSSIKKDLNKSKVLISVMAGVKIRSIKEIVGDIPVVRIMPNTPMLIGEGAIGVAFDEQVSNKDRKYLSEVLESMGEVVFTEEDLIDAITGLSGSGPAYVFVMIDAMAQGGVKMGLSYQDALKLSVQTVLGSAKMLKELGEHPSILRDKITSPAGTTIYGLHKLEEKGFRDAIISAIEEATKRSKQLS